MIKRIHINQHVIRRNNKQEDPAQREPVIAVKHGRSNEYYHELAIDGPCRIVYRPDKPLSCGARLWIETTAEVY